MPDSGEGQQNVIKMLNKIKICRNYDITHLSNRFECRLCEGQETFSVRCYVPGAQEDYLAHIRCSTNINQVNKEGGISEQTNSHSCGKQECYPCDTSSSWKKLVFRTCLEDIFIIIIVVLEDIFWGDLATLPSHDIIELFVVMEKERYYLLIFIEHNTRYQAPSQAFDEYQPL